MDRHVIDYADARNMMVDGQIRPNRVYDPRILAAMRRLPRERFLPDSLAARAYVDGDVRLAGGRVLVEPLVIARLVQLLAIRDGERALVVGCGTGYGAALLSACGAQVTALEEDDALLAIARGVLPDVAPRVRLVSGRLVDGWSADGPYDAVMIEGGVEAIPPAIARLVSRPGGRLTTVVVAQGRIGCIVLAEPTSADPESASLSIQPAFDCATPVIPQLQREPDFVF